MDHSFIRGNKCPLYSVKAATAEEVLGAIALDYEPGADGEWKFHFSITVNMPGGARTIGRSVFFKPHSPEAMSNTGHLGNFFADVIWGTLCEVSEDMNEEEMNDGTKQEIKRKISVMIGKERRIGTL